MKARILSEHRSLPPELRSAPANEEQLLAFESEFCAIPPEYRWYLAQCGGGIAGAETLDSIHDLPGSHRKFQKESGSTGWRMTNTFIFGWVLAPSFLEFLARAWNV